MQILMREGVNLVIWWSGDLVVAVLKH